MRNDVEFSGVGGGDLMADGAVVRDESEGVEWRDLHMMMILSNAVSIAASHTSVRGIASLHWQSCHLASRAFLVQLHDLIH